MKRIASMVVLVSVVAVLLPAIALGQEKSDSGVTGMAQQQKPEKPVTSLNRKHRAMLKGDIRHCLEFTENVQVIKCAEKRR